MILLTSKSFRGVVIQYLSRNLRVQCPPLWVGMGDSMMLSMARQSRGQGTRSEFTPFLKDVDLPGAAAASLGR
jgi:hypothetical protein